MQYYNKKDYKLEISSIKSIRFLQKKVWDPLVKEDTPLFNYDFLNCLERSGCTKTETGWEPNHFIIKKNQKTICIVPTFRKFNSNGEFVFDHAWADAYHRLGIKYYPKLLAGVPFTPVNGNRIFYDKNSINILDNFIPILKNELEDRKLSSFHLNFIDKKQSDILKNFNFLQRIGIQYHWINDGYEKFDDFLKTLKNKKKKNILKERDYIKNSKIKIFHLIGDQISKSDWDFFYNCYSSTIDKKWSYKYLNFSFFKLLSNTELKKKVLMILAKDQEGENLACTLNFIGKNKLFGRYWGCIKDIPNLHFELCYYQSIEFAINNKIKIIEAGAQGEHKISRGYSPHFTYSNHWIENEQMREAIEDYLEREKKIIIQNMEYLKERVPYK